MLSKIHDRPTGEDTLGGACTRRGQKLGAGYVPHWSLRSASELQSLVEPRTLRPLSRFRAKATVPARKLSTGSPSHPPLAQSLAAQEDVLPPQIQPLQKR